MANGKPAKGKAKVKITSSGKKRLAMVKPGKAKGGGARVKPGTSKGDSYCALDLAPLRKDAERKSKRMTLIPRQ